MDDRLLSVVFRWLFVFHFMICKQVQFGWEFSEFRTTHFEKQWRKRFIKNMTQHVERIHD